MNKMKPFAAALFGVAFVAMSGAAMANTHGSINGHRPSDHTMDSMNHPYEARQGSHRASASGFVTISPRDRQLQRLDDIKPTNHPYEARQGAHRSSMSGFVTISPRDRELQRIDDLKRQTTDGYSLNVGPSGFQPIVR